MRSFAFSNWSQYLVGIDQNSRVSLAAIYKGATLKLRCANRAPEAPPAPFPHNDTISEASVPPKTLAIKEVSRS